MLQREKRLSKLLERFKIAVEGGVVPRPQGTFTTYAISNFRGGIGKSTLAFNLAWEVSRKSKTLLMDACPQCNCSSCYSGRSTLVNVTGPLYLLA